MQRYATLRKKKLVNKRKQMRTKALAYFCLLSLQKEWLGLWIPVSADDDTQPAASESHAYFVKGN